MSYSQIGVTIKGAAVILELRGNLEVGQHVQLKKDILASIDQRKKVILNFAHVDFIDSAGLSALLGVQRQVHEGKGHIVLAALNEEIRSIFQITRLEQVFNIHEDVESALKTLDD
jgi:anti-sigma B factor antagonist